MKTSTKVMIALALLFTVLYLWAEFLDNAKVGQ